jgi:hypothetical protein
MPIAKRRAAELSNGCFLARIAAPGFGHLRNSATVSYAATSFVPRVLLTSTTA